MNRMRTRDVVLAVAIAAGFIVHAIGADWSALSASGHVILALLGLAIAFGAVGTMIYDHVVASIDAEPSTAVREPALSRFLFHDTRSAPLWLAVRLYVGIAWLTAGWEKITGSPSWLSNGSALKGFWTNAAAIPKTGKPAISYDWYRAFLQFMLNHQWYDWFAKVICLRRGADRHRPDRRRAVGDRGLLRGADEHELPAGGQREHEPGALHGGDPAHAGVAGGGVLGRGPLHPAAARRAVEPRPDVAGSEERGGRDTTPTPGIAGD